jgi:hypothetical protein
MGKAKNLTFNCLSSPKRKEAKSVVFMACEDHAGFLVLLEVRLKDSFRLKE